MNERIKELAIQVGAVQNVLAMGRHDGVLFTETELEKFVQLIVRECIKVMYDNAIERKVGLEIDKRPTYYAAAILEHFGVEK